MRKLLLICSIGLAIYLYWPKIQAVLTVSPPKDNAVSKPPDGNAKTLADSIIKIAMGQLGKPYHFGGNGQKGFDCSGFVYYCFRQAGVQVPRSSKGYVNFGQEVPLAQARKGDIMLFSDTNPEKKTAGHVGIILSEPTEKQLRFIHSSSSKKNWGVVITNYSENEHYQKRFMKVVRAF